MRARDERRAHDGQHQPQWRLPVTLLRFSGGEAVEVTLSLSEVQKLIQEAIRKDRLLELHAPDGRLLVVNPRQVQYLQNGADVEADANGGSPAGDAGVAATA